MKELADLFRKKFEKKVKIILYEGSIAADCVCEKQVICQGRVKFFEEGSSGLFSHKDSFAFAVLRTGYFPLARVRIEAKDGSVLVDQILRDWKGFDLDNYWFSEGGKLIIHERSSIMIPREWMI